MKKITLLLFLALTGMLNVANAQDITVFNFDGTTPVFDSWSDSFVSVANPVPDGVNASVNVGKYTHNNIWSEITIDLATPIDSRYYTSFQFKVYSPAAGTLIIGCKNAANNTTLSSYSAAQTVTAGWTTITQNIAATQPITKIFFSFQLGTEPAGGSADVIYLDDLTFIKTTNPDIRIYGENFTAKWEGGDWTGKPSTELGQWFGGIDLETTADANMTLSQYWNDHGHVLKMAPAAAAVIIPNINITGFNNLKLSFDVVWPWSSAENDAFWPAPNENKLPVIEIKSGSGSWTPLTVAPFTQDWTTQNLVLSGIDNTQPLSVRISNSSTLFTMAVDNLTVTGTSVSLATESNQLNDNSIQVYPNPFASEFKVDATNSEGPLQVSVFDVLGRKVATAKSSSNQLSMGSSLNSGVYIVKVEGTNGKDSKSFKVIKK